jgi:arylsulfatase A-like enzyme
MAGVEDALKSSPESAAVFTKEAGQGDSAREIAVHLPLAIRFPGLAPRTASGILMSQVDLMPTLASLFGLMPPDEVHGRNLAPLLKREEAEIPDSIFLQGPDWRAVIRGYDKLVTDLKVVPLHQYNLAEDPGEETDQVTDPRVRLIRDALRALTQQWMKKVVDQIDPSGLRVR